MAPFDQGRNAREMVRMRELDCKGRARCGGSNLRGGQGAWVEAELVKDALEPFGGPTAHPQRVRGSRKIGRASCRGREEISEVAGSLKKKEKFDPVEELLVRNC